MGGAGTSPAFPSISQDEYGIRRQAVAAGMEAAGLDAMCVFYPARVAYLTGFHHIPTERPIALVLGPKGFSALLVPAVALGGQDEIIGRVIQCLED